jgi:hypothetical protein
MNQSYEAVLNAARQLPLNQQQLLVQTLLDEAGATRRPLTEEQAAALEIVEQLSGTIKGLDRETIIWLAEDEELCGY